MAKNDNLPPGQHPITAKEFKEIQAESDKKLAKQQKAAAEREDRRQKTIETLTDKALESRKQLEELQNLGPELRKSITEPIKDILATPGKMMSSFIPKPFMIMTKMLAKNIPVIGTQARLQRKEQKAIRQRDKFIKAEEKRESKREKTQQKTEIESAAKKAGSGGFLKGFFGGGLSKILGVFGSMAAVLGGMLAPLATLALIGIIVAGVSFIASDPKTQKWIKSNITNNPKVQGTLLLIEKHIVGALGAIVGGIVNSAERAVKRWWANEFFYSDQNMARKHFRDKLRKRKITPGDAAREYGEQGFDVTPEVQRFFEQEYIKGEVTRLVHNVGERPDKRAVMGYEADYIGRAGAPGSEEEFIKRRDHTAMLFKQKLQENEAKIAAVDATMKQVRENPRYGRNQIDAANKENLKARMELEGIRSQLQRAEKNWKDTFKPGTFDSSPPHLGPRGVVGKSSKESADSLSKIKDLMGKMVDFFSPSSDHASSSTEFDLMVASLAKKLGISPTALKRVMQFESGLNPAAINEASGASGLIQIMPKELAAMGTTSKEFATMSREEQMPFIEKYFFGDDATGYKGIGAGHLRKLQKAGQGGRKLSGAEALYLSVLYPKALGGQEYNENTGFGKWTERDRGDVIFDKTSLNEKSRVGYKQNAGLDRDKDGKITIGDILNRFNEKTQLTGLDLVGSQIMDFAAEKGAEEGLETSVKKAVATQTGEASLKRAGLKGLVWGARKAPFGIGALISLGLATNRALAGDMEGAAVQMASGLASIVPGYGTALSFGIDAAYAGSQHIGSIPPKERAAFRTLQQMSRDEKLALGYSGGLISAQEDYAKSVLQGTPSSHGTSIFNTVNNRGGDTVQVAAKTFRNEKNRWPNSSTLVYYGA